MDLNLRNVPDELVKAIKVEAAGRGVTLRELCLEKLSSEGTTAPVKRSEGESEPVQVAVRVREPEREVAKERPDPAANEKLRPCDRCGGATVEWGPQRRCMKCCINYTR